MRHPQTKKLILATYDELTAERWNWPGKPLPDYANLVRQRNKFVSCGRSLIVPKSGHEITHWCRRPVCPACSTFSGRKAACDLIEKYPEADLADFRKVTLIQGISSDLDDAFGLFRENRTALHKAIDYRRGAPGLNRAGWRAFGATGSLEIDMFMAEQFHELGNTKQQQYRMLGFDPRAGVTGPIWVTTVHALVHIGILGEDAVKDAFQSIAPVVHLRELEPTQTLREAAEATVGYASKVSFETAFAFPRIDPWPLEAVKTYLLAVMHNSQGRKGFRLVVNPKRSRVRKTREKYIEPMAVLL